MATTQACSIIQIRGSLPISWPQRRTNDAADHACIAPICLKVLWRQQQAASYLHNGDSLITAAAEPSEP